MPSPFEAASVEPYRTTARKTRTSDQLRNPFFISVEQHNDGADTRATTAPLALGSDLQPGDDPMTSLSLAPRLSLIDRVARMLPRRAAVTPVAQDPSEAEAARARRAFLMEKLDASPAAFASEEGVCEMMALYPHDF